MNLDQEAWRSHRQEVLLTVTVLLIGILEAVRTDSDVSSRWSLVAVSSATAVAVALARHSPGSALVLAWATCGAQVVADVPIMLVQLTLVMVAFGTARWGNVHTLTASALSIPLSGLVAALLAGAGTLRFLTDIAPYQPVIAAAPRFGDTLLVGAVLGATAVLGVPWLAGLALRFHAGAASSKASQIAAEEGAARAQREAEQALEIARLRDEQARLARDVHDVVGHSLAVILAQAESGQFLSDDDSESMKNIMQTIATSARSSLQEVRQVLTTTSGPGAPDPGGLDALIEGVRTSGHQVVSTQVGIAQPLPPEIEIVAFRVLQEMLTNAIRHGRRDSPFNVERHWDRELRIEVGNIVNASSENTRPALAADPTISPGHGIEGMRRRLDSVGGRLDVRQRTEDNGPSFTATAWVPLRTLGL